MIRKSKTKRRIFAFLFISVLIILLAVILTGCNGDPDNRVYMTVNYGTDDRGKDIAWDFSVSHLMFLAREPIKKDGQVLPLIYNGPSNDYKGSFIDLYLRNMYAKSIFSPSERQALYADKYGGIFIPSRIEINTLAIIGAPPAPVLNGNPAYFKRYWRPTDYFLRHEGNYENLNEDSVYGIKCTPGAPGGDDDTIRFITMPIDKPVPVYPAMVIDPDRIAFVSETQKGSEIPASTPHLTDADTMYSLNGKTVKLTVFDPERMGRFKADESTLEVFKGQKIILHNVPAPQKNQFIRCTLEQSASERSIDYTIDQTGIMAYDADSNTASIGSSKADLGSYSMHIWMESNEGTNSNTNIASEPLVIPLLIKDAPQITYVAGSNGSIKGNLKQSCAYGEMPSKSLIPEASPDPGYYFKEWQDSKGNPVRPEETLVTDNITYTAVFAEIDFLFNLSAEESGGPTEKITSTVFVDCSARGKNNGSTWEDAFNNLQDAIDASRQGDRIWIAAGTYEPTKDMHGNIPENPRDKTFMLKNGVSIYGGFEGNEDADTFNLNSRDLQKNKTILSGDLQGDNSGEVKEESVFDEVRILDAVGDAYAFILDDSLNADTFKSLFKQGKGVLGYTSLDQREFTAIMDALDHRDPDRLLQSLPNDFVGKLDAETAKDVYSIAREYVVYKALRDKGEDWLSIADKAFGLTHNTHVWKWEDDCYTVITGVDISNSTMLDGLCISGGGGDRLQDFDFLGGFYAGGITLFKGSPVISNCTFTRNTGIFAASLCNTLSSPGIFNCTFTENVVPNGVGGAILNVYNSSPVIKNCDFVNNYTDGSGGAIFNAGGDGIIENCTFTGNYAQMGGAVAYLYDNRHEGELLDELGSEFAGVRIEPASGRISNCIFSLNQSFEEGAAIYVQGDVPLNIDNSVFALNFTWMSKHGSIEAEGSAEITITNCTLSGNYSLEEPAGPAVVLAGENAKAVINNSIIWQDGSSRQISFVNEAAVEVNYSCIKGGWQGAGTDNIDRAPVFIESGNFDVYSGTPLNLRLAASSPCIDAGSNSVAPAFLTDLDGNNRMMDVQTVEDTGEGKAPVIDMGAYEAIDYPSAPTNLELRNRTKEEIKFSWTASKSQVGIKEYQIYRIEDDGSKKGITPDAMKLIDTTGYKGFTDRGLQPGTVYYYTVRAVDSLGFLSPYSDILRVSTRPLHSPRRSSTKNSNEPEIPPKSDNANLSELTVSGCVYGNMEPPEFDAARTTYHLDIDPDLDPSLSFTLVAEDDNASIIIEIIDLSDDSTYLYEEFGSSGTTESRHYDGEYQATITVTAQDCITTKIYKLIINAYDQGDGSCG